MKGAANRTEQDSQNQLFELTRDRMIDFLCLRYAILNASVILERNEKRLERNKTLLARNETRGGNLLLGGTV